ncbi:MAG: DNA translocase FtsK [Candidatus Puniceispirillaceae bacterium]
MSQGDAIKPVMSEVVKRFIGHRISELFGLFLLLCGGALMVALITANEGDPSLNNAVGDVEIQNWLGLSGAYIADFLNRIFGIGPAFLMPLALMSWGLRWVVHVGLPSWYWRMPFLSVAIAFLASSVAAACYVWGLDNQATTKATGIIGVTLFQTGEAALSSFALPEMMSSSVVVGVVCLIAGGWLYIWSAGLSRAKWGLVHLITKPVFWLLFLPFALFRKSAPAKPVTVSDDEGDIVSKADVKADKKAKKQAEKKAEKQALKEAKKQQAAAKKEARKLAKQQKATGRKEPVLVPGAETLAEEPKGTKRKKATAVPENQTSFDFESQSGFQLPSHNLLKPPSKASEGPGDEILQQHARMLEGVLSDFGVNGEIKDVAYGPVVTRYGLNPAAGTKSQRVIALADDIARSMSALSVRVAVVPGQNVIGIEMPNDERETVLLRDILDHEAWYQNEDSLPICLGKDIAGLPVVTDLAKMPHLLVAGTTGSGKSVGINAMILSLLYRHTPETCRLIMIDPKMLELSVYDGIPHLLSPVVTDPAKAVTSLKWAVREMENRYFNMSKLGVRNITGYNQRLAEARRSGEVLTRRVQTGFDAETGRPTFEEQSLDLAPLPFIVVIIDEVADLMLVAGKDIEAAVQRLAQMARAAGIHVIMATQRPSVDVITGTIKANFPTRISFQVTSKIDSRTILGEQGAEQLLGRGDMLFMEGGGRIKRVHGPFMEDQEVEKVANFLRAQGEPEYDDRVTAEPEEQTEQAGGAGAQPTGESLYDQAVALVVREQRASTSFVQRHLKIGYNRAATIIEEMESAGVISKANHAGKREVLIQND